MNRVLHIIDSARGRLATLRQEAPVIDAASILANPATPLVVVCDAGGRAVGVISRMDLVKLLSRMNDAAFGMDAAAVMTRGFLSCREGDALQAVWEALSARGLRCTPVLDPDGRPVGVLHARELVRALLDEVTTEEMLLRDYVLGVGYR